MPTLQQGTKEYLMVDVTDETGNIVSLDGLTPQYRVLKADDSDQIAWTSAPNVAMKVKCMIDTNTPSLWAAGAYRIYCRFTASPELPWIGPFIFDVEAP
jgi:hypothetical protein